MSFKSRRAWITLAIVLGGCAGANPFIATRFAGGLVNSGAGGGATQPSDPNIRNSCDLAADRKSFFSYAVFNQARNVVQYSLVFIATTGTGGFVCSDDVDDYQRAGYRPITPTNATRTLQVGCELVPLDRGTSFLVLEVSGQIAANNSGNPQDAPVAAAPFNGSTPIPIPERIVLGTTSTADTSFLCNGNNPCTQAGFRYLDVAGNLISKVIASRTQGTICQSAVSNLPEWRLLDVNAEDNTASQFQYVAGGGVVILVRDRANDLDPNRVQVSWIVADRAGNIIHQPLP